MKCIVTIAVATLFISSEHAFAEGLARAQVYDEMVQYQSAGFNPARQNPRSWVDDAQRASAKVIEARDSNTPVREASKHHDINIAA